MDGHLCLGHVSASGLGHQPIIIKIAHLGCWRSSSHHQHGRRGSDAAEELDASLDLHLAKIKIRFFLKVLESHEIAISRVLWVLLELCGGALWQA